MASVFPTRTSIVAVDLTSTGAPVEWQRDRDPETESFIMARLAGLAKILDRAGADLITLGSPFKLGGRRRRDEHLDGALALSRLGEHTSQVRFAGSIPLSRVAASEISAAVGQVHRLTGNRGGWQVDSPTPEPARRVETVSSALARLNAPTTVVVNVRNEVDVEIAAARATVARLQVATVEEARNLRSAIRAAAHDWGRQPGDVAVLVDIRTVIADDAAAAQNRALFLDDVESAAGQGALRHVGTVSTLATVWQNWLRAGAADGFTILPASVPADVVQVASGLIPELDRRGLHARLAAPVSAHAEARARRRVVAV